MSEMLSDIIYQALQEDRTITINNGEHGLEIAIDGQVVARGFPSESFNYPAFGRRGVVEEKAEDLARDLLQRRDRRIKRSRMQRLTTDAHQAAHGKELPIDGDSA